MNRDLPSEDQGLRKDEEPAEVEALGIPFVNSPHPMWVYDVATLGFLEVNEAAIRGYGFSRQEFMNMTLLDIRPGEDVRTFLHSWEHSHESEQENWRHVGKDGKTFPVSITSWELNFRGRKAELVEARRSSAHGDPISQAESVKPSSIRRDSSDDSAKRGA